MRLKPKETRLPLSNSSLLLLAVLALAVGALAGCATLIDSRATTRETTWEAENPPVGRLLALDGRQVHVLEAGRPQGTAPDIVLIHGANGNLRDFTFDLVDRLAPDWRVIAVDRPGLGWSDSWGEADSDPRFQARILRHALAEVGVTRPLVLGHSYGGAVAMAWALEAPEDTAALVLLAGATHPWPGDLGFWYRMHDSALGRFARAALAALAPKSVAEGVLQDVFAPAPMPPGYSEHFGTGLALRRDQQAANARQVNALLEHVSQMRPHYADLTLPIEAVHGAADTIVGLEIHSAALAGEVDSVNLTVIEGAGHMPHHSHPQVVMDAIDRAARRAGLR
ncbi:alpha/beta hydrolase [Pararhodobacter sp. SW119]|uniref:alpha/beta fold hydrolase n=1 Tax=Pararhodobacter sp. SW119 TaxID=2780075 RepID=UPI001FD73367|nr:alpha/beta hydrolase [Pararhodobacter sp. SW119]